MIGDGSILGVVSAVLLWAGCACLVMACLGGVAMRGVYDRLHFVAIGAVLGAPLVVIALAITASGGRPALKLLLIGALLAATGPVTTVVTARAARAGGDRRRERAE